MPGLAQQFAQEWVQDLIREPAFMREPIRESECGPTRALELTVHM